MPNRNFVVQYTIKAANKFSGVAAKFDRVAKKIKSNVEAIKTAVRKGGAELDKFKAKLNSVGRGMRNFGAKATLGISLPVGLAARSMIKAAADAEETKSKFNTVFDSISADANKTANDLVKSFDLSRIESRKLLADTGDLLVGFGFSKKAALDMSTQVQKLSIDLASFTNIEGGATRASSALTKALLGERESIKSLGIAILEEDVKKKVAILRAKGMRFESMRQAKAIATLQLAMEQSKSAIGDYARTSGSAANRSRKLSARFDDLKVTIGTKLLPIALRLTNFLIKIIDKFEALSPVTQNIILGFIGFAAVVGPVLMAVGSLIMIFTALKAASLAAVASMALAAAPFLATAAAAMAVFTAVKMAVGKLLELGGLTEKLESFGASVFKFFNEDEINLSKDLNLNQKSQTDVNLNVGLAGGLEQKGGANISQRGRPGNVGLNAAGA